MNLSLTSSDVAILLIYALSQVWVFFKLFHPKNPDAVDYFVVGRNVTLPAFVATLVSTWYGGVLGVGEYSYRYGISNWFVFGVPYYLCAIGFAVFLAKKARESEFFTICDQLDSAYGKGVSIPAAIFVFLQTNPAPYLLILGVLGQTLFGWDLLSSLVVGTLFSIIYIFRGGMRSVIWADVIQFLLMFTGFAAVLAFVFFKFGGLSFLKAHLPSNHFSWKGGNSTQYVISWYFIALQTLVAPAFYQRCYSAKNVGVAQNGIWISVIFWILFDFMTTFTGLYARAVLPNLENPVHSYPALAEAVLPAGLKGLFFVGMLATVMSTVNSFSFLSAVTIGKDLIARMRNEFSETDLKKYTQYGLFVTTVLSIFFAYTYQSVVGLWYEFGTLSTAVLLIPLVSSFSIKYRMSVAAVKVSMIGSALIPVGWKFYEVFNPGVRNWEPILPALGWSLMIAIIDRVQHKIFLSKKMIQ